MKKFDPFFGFYVLLAIGVYGLAVCGSLLQRVAVCCSVLQCVAVRCSMLHGVVLSVQRAAKQRRRKGNTLQCALQCVAVRYTVSQYVAVCCIVLQCVAVCCSLLYCVAIWRNLICSMASTGQNLSNLSSLPIKLYEFDDCNADILGKFFFP